MHTERLHRIVRQAVSAIFAQITGGRVACESEATLQLHLGRIISLVADLELVGTHESFTIELEKPFTPPGEKRGRIDIWFALTNSDGEVKRCAMELKFFKKANQREPNNRYDVFKDIRRLERCGFIADAAFMLVVTDHEHYVRHLDYSPDTGDFDFRHGKAYRAGSELNYRTGSYGDGPIVLYDDYQFAWVGSSGKLQYLLVDVAPR